MRYAVFYPVDNNKDYDRHTFDNIFYDKIIAECYAKLRSLKYIILKVQIVVKKWVCLTLKMTTTMRNLMAVIG